MVLRSPVPANRAASAILCALGLACQADAASPSQGASSDGPGSTDGPASNSSPATTLDESSGTTSSTDDTGGPQEDPPPSLATIEPDVIDPIGGSWVVVRGTGLLGADRLTIGDVEVTRFEIISDAELHARTGPVDPAPYLDVVVERDGVTATLADAVQSWSPAELVGARLFDAAVGLELEESVTTYEWQRLTANIGDDWRVRDGNTTTWLPATERYWMVAGWNGLQEPEGFSMVPPDSVYPPQNTSDEVWSSADGMTWTLELPHGHGQFERRHSHNMMLWNDRLWMIGGDTHQGYYNHDVVSSADGVQWDVVLGPGTTPPPWSQRALQTSGVYDGKLWMFGGQDALGPPDEYIYHNDVWNTEDGVQWTQIAADGPGSATRPAGCGVLDGLVEFHGELWLVGCARERGDAVGHSMSNEVWSTTDGIAWTLHAEPPWVGKIWPNVVVWDDKLWILFGYTYGDPANGWTPGNANEAWYSEDGETWTSLPIDAPVPGSHAQGVAVMEDFLLFAGGNYSFGFGAGPDKSAWRLVRYRGEAVHGWTDRGSDARRVAAITDDARPTWLADGLGDDIAGLQFDGSSSVLELDMADEQPKGRSVFWIARAPYLPRPWGWIETFDPVGTIVGGPAPQSVPVSSIGLSDGQVVYMNREQELGELGEFVYTRVSGGNDLQQGPGEIHMAGMTHATDGTMQVWVDGTPVETTGTAGYETPRLWTRIGGGSDGGYYGVNSRFAGTLGAVIVLPEVADAQLVARMYAWARGRFGVP
jgi:hypothetical protein